MCRLDARFKKPAVMAGVFVSLSIAGCADAEKFSVVPVSGIVTLDGEPVTGISVTFSPQVGEEDQMEAPPRSYGQTDGDGRFVLTTAERESRDGAHVGRHRVYFGGKPDPNDEFGQIEVLPKNRGETYYDVPEGGTDAAEFAF